VAHLVTLGGDSVVTRGGECTVTNLGWCRFGDDNSVEALRSCGGSFLRGYPEDYVVAGREGVAGDEVELRRS